MASTPIYCVNHSQTETLLRCIKCDKPYCIKCLVRTPVGYRCKECLNIQQAGYYTATSSDYAVAAVVGVVASILGGAIAAAIGSIFLFTIFYAPFAGGVIAEIIRGAIQKHRGRHLWLVACGAVIVGSAIGAGMPSLLATLPSLRGDINLLAVPLIFPLLALRAVFNLGFLIYIALAVGTVYARLR